MSTSRNSSRTNGNMTQAQSSSRGTSDTPPRRAKVATNAQMDISSISFTTPSRASSRLSTISSSSSALYAGNQGQQPQQKHLPNSRPSIKVRSSGPVSGGTTMSSFRNNTISNTQTIKASNGPGVLNNNSNSNGILRRIGTAGIGLGGVGLNGTGSGAGGGRKVGGPPSLVLNNNNGLNSLRGLKDGSVTSSDDGTISEDSIEDQIQLFSGAGGGQFHLNGIPFTASRHSNQYHHRQNQNPGSVTGSSAGGPLPKMASSTTTKVANGKTIIRTGTSTNASTNASDPSTKTPARPIRRIAPGASIHVDTPPSTTTTAPVPIPTLSLSSSMDVTEAGGALGSSVGSAVAHLLSTSASSSTSSSSLSWISPPSSASSSQRNSVNGKSLTPTLPSFRLEEEEEESSSVTVVAAAVPFRVPSPTPSASSHGSQQSQQQQQQTQQQTVAPTQTTIHLSTSSNNESGTQQGVAQFTPSTARNTTRSNKVVTSMKQASGEINSNNNNRRTEDAARTRRKIADLEISNTSLLQINQSLEATVRKQAAEILELKQRMQQSSSSTQFNISGDNDSDLLLLADITSQDRNTTTSTTTTTKTSSVIAEETAVIILELTEAERQADLTFKRLCVTIEQMMFEARQALDQSMRPAGVKVLSSFDIHEDEEMEDDDTDPADQSLVLEDDDEDKVL
ncbi:hypothetical protein BGX28_010040 [Mortierella sp. GBA30]|nr:hypothetical protein BGX28_010040 [Mortierella sp. GBA30]